MQRFLPALSLLVVGVLLWVLMLTVSFWFWWLYLAIGIAVLWTVWGKTWDVFDIVVTGGLLWLAYIFLVVLIMAIDPTVKGRKMTSLLRDPYDATQ